MTNKHNPFLQLGLQLCAVLAIAGLVGSMPGQAAEVPQELPPEAWTRILDQVRASQYDLSRRAESAGDAEDAIWVATHHDLNLEFEFNPQGMRVQPRGAEQRSWTWGLQFAGFGTEDDLQVAKPALPHVEGNRVEYRRPGLLEWYVHNRRGVEQGFTVESSPPGSPDRMRIELAVSGTLTASLTSGGDGVTLRDIEGVTALRYAGLNAYDTTGRDLPAWIELSKNVEETPHLVLWVEIREAEFPVVIDPLITTQVAKLTASDAAASNEFGYSVSISGDTVVVGSLRDGQLSVGTGAAYVFERNVGGADNWGQVAKLTASDTASDDEFGVSVAISGDTVVVGAVAGDAAVADSGSAYVYERNTGGADNWGEVTKLKASDATVDDEFGISVAISGDTVVVGAHRDDDVNNDSGSAYVFERNLGGADSWGEVAKLKASNAAPGDRFGISVSISGDTAVVGSLLGDSLNADTGSAYVFERNTGGANSWGQAARLDASDGKVSDQFGNSVSISGHTVVVGANLDDDAGVDSGSAYVYERNVGGADNWGEVAKLTASDAAAEDEFGFSVSISVDRVVVGAPFDDDTGMSSGSAYVYVRNTGGADSWGQLAKLTASDAAAEDEFGLSVSISSDTVVAGAHFDDDVGSNSGSAYTFTVRGCQWVEVAKPVASDAAAFDHFGRSVSISGDMVVVGALRDDDGGMDSGSAYVYERNTGGADSWGQVAKLTASDAAAEDVFGHYVSISGDTVVVAAGFDDDAGVNSGSAYVFERNVGGADSWGQVAKLTASDAAAEDVFGRSVSISGDTVVVGADGNDDGGFNSGSAYVYERNTGGPDIWGQVVKLTASDAAASDWFGYSVSISGDTVVVAARLDDDAGMDSGSAYVFARNAGGADSWGEVAKLTASDAVADDEFGYSVSISGDTVAVGAFHDDDGGMDSGSAYVYERNKGGADIWGQVAKLTASDAAAGDEFGRSVSISRDRVVVGALFDDDAGVSSGSAYVYERNAGGADIWGQVAKLTASDAAGSNFFGGSVSISGDTVVAGADENDDAGVNSGSAYTFKFSCPDCGDGLQEPPEECDDGAGNSDVTPDACRTDCTLPRCGDAVQDTGEECDDGNMTDGDGCDNDCTISACFPAPDCSVFDTDCGAASCDPAGASGNCDILTALSANTLCNAGSGDACNPDEFCTGVPGETACPADVILPDGSSCEDGDVCTSNDQCTEGHCQPGVPAPDMDSDGVCDEIDNCPTVGNPLQKDFDLDGAGDACDCAPNDDNLIFAPLEITGLTGDRIAGGDVRISWDSQDTTAGSDTNYDVARGILSMLAGGYPAGAVCAQNDALDTPYTEPAIDCSAGPDDGCWYLVRAQSSCGTATYGTGTLGDTVDPGPCP